MRWYMDVREAKDAERQRSGRAPNHIPPLSCPQPTMLTDAELEAQIAKLDSESHPLNAALIC